MTTHPSDQPRPEQVKLSESYERYDLTGSRIRRWTVKAREKLMVSLRCLKVAGKRAATEELPGADGTLVEKAKTAPGKGVEFLEGKLEQVPVENRLKSAQTETEFLKQELLRTQIANTAADTAKKAAETKGQELDNVQKEIEIRERIAEITSGKTEIHVLEFGDSKSVVFGNIPKGLIGVEPDDA